jgi:hypothetical protein
MRKSVPFTHLMLTTIKIQQKMEKLFIFGKSDCVYVLVAHVLLDVSVVVVLVTPPYVPV